MKNLFDKIKAIIKENDEKAAVRRKERREELIYKIKFLLVESLEESTILADKIIFLAKIIKNILFFLGLGLIIYLIVN